LYDEKVHDANNYSFEKYHFLLKDISFKDVPNSKHIIITD